jgi:integrase
VELKARTIDTIKLPEGRSEIIVTDSKIPGFGIRVRAGGTRVLTFSYKLGTKNRRITLGPAVKEAFPDVRKRALELLSQVRLGQDPAAVRDAARAPARDVETFEKIARRYLAQMNVRPKTYAESERYLLVLAKPLHSKPITSITRSEIAEVLSDAAATRGSATANRLRASLTGLFGWSMREGLVVDNCVTNTNERDELPRNRTLVRVDPETEELDMSELVAVWKVLPNNAFGDAVRLLILTGQRRQEIGGLRWSELDENLTRITLPPARQKNKGGKQRLDHIIPLSEPARVILLRRHRVDGWQCVFSSSSGGIGNWAEWKRNLDAKLHGMEPWVLHDLRRSVSTGMNCLGVQPHIVEATLNHISGFKSGVAGTYNQYPYEKEKRQALTLWAEHLMATVSGTTAKVVPIRSIG